MYPGINLYLSSPYGSQNPGIPPLNSSSNGCVPQHGHNRFSDQCPYTIVEHMYVYMMIIVIILGIIITTIIILGIIITTIIMI